MQDALRNPVYAGYRTRQRPREGAPLEKLDAADVVAQPRTKWPAIFDAETLQRGRERIRRGTELLVDGNIERQAYDDLVAKARADSESAENELAAVRHERQPSRAKLPPLEDVLKAAGSWTAVLQGADVEAQRAVLAVLVERVVPIRERQGVYRVEITWTPHGKALRATTAA